jgi:hypothetical protein
MCFVRISEQIAIVPPYSIKWLIFKTLSGCVYCAVQTEPVTVYNSPLFTCFVWSMDLGTNRDCFPYSINSLIFKILSGVSTA